MSYIILLFFKSNLANTGHIIVDLMDFFTKLVGHTTKKVGNRWPAWPILRIKYCINDG